MCTIQRIYSLYGTSTRRTPWNVIIYIVIFPCAHISLWSHNLKFSKLKIKLRFPEIMS